MQQNLRVAVQILSENLHMARFDPDQNANTDFTVATATRFGFTMDLDEDGAINRLGGTGEEIYFGLDPADDADNNGVIDNGIGTLNQSFVQNFAGNLPIAESVEAIEFSYILAGNAQNTNSITGELVAIRAPTNAELNNITKVQISILVRERNQDLKYANPHTYTPLPTAQSTATIGSANNPVLVAARPAPWGGPAARVAAGSNNFHRRLLTTTILCRNL